MSQRRVALRYCLAGALLAASCFAAAAQAQTKLRFTLDWRFEGQLAMFMMAKNKGYYEKAGLDVAIDAGSGSAAAIQRIVAGSHDLGTGDLTALIEYAGNNPGPTRLQAVYLIYNQSPFMVHALKSSGIARPQDLAGKRIAAPVFDAARKSFPIFAKQVGIDPASISWVNADPAMRETLLARGQVDAASGFELNRLNLIARGVKDEDIVMFKMSDYGVKLYGNAILASQKLIDENPAAVAAFVRASNRALVDTIADPVEAIKYNKQFDALVDEGLELKKLRLTLHSIDTAYARAAGLGGIDMDVLATQAAQVSEVFKLKSRPDARQLFNPAFLPPQAERMPRR